MESPPSARNSSLQDTPSKRLASALARQRTASRKQNNDPDDFLNTHGPEAFKQLLASSQSLSECIWKRETEERIFDSPERIVALDKRLSYLSNQISDQNLRRAYFNYFQKAKQAMLSNDGFKDFKSSSSRTKLD